MNTWLGGEHLAGGAFLDNKAHSPQTGMWKLQLCPGSRGLCCVQTAPVCVSLCPQARSPALSWDELSPSTQRSSRPDWSPEGVTHGVSQKQRNGFHHSSQHSLQENLPSLGSPALGEGDRGANLEPSSHGTETPWKNELLPGCVDEM